MQYNWGIVPYRKPLNLVVGSPIRVEKVPEPTDEQILDLHKRYTKALVALYEEYNPKYGTPGVKLVIG